MIPSAADGAASTVPVYAASPSVISWPRSLSTLPGYSMRRVCRNASASRTASLRGSPDSRSARARARHSSRNQYRPSSASRCQLSVAVPTARAAIAHSGTVRGGRARCDRAASACSRRPRYMPPTSRRPTGSARSEDQAVAGEPRRVRADWSRSSVSACRRSPSARRSTRPTDGRRRARRAPGLP